MSKFEAGIKTRLYLLSLINI